MVPASCMEDITLTGYSDLAKWLNSVNNAASGACMADTNPIVVHAGRDTFRYDSIDYTNVIQATLLDDELILLVFTNYRATVAAGWEDHNADIVAAIHIMAFLMRVIESGGWKLVNDLASMTSQTERKCS